MRSETPARGGRSKGTENDRRAAGQLRDSIRRAKAEALASIIRGGFYGGELALTREAFGHLLALGLTRREVHQAAADLEAAERLTIRIARGSIVLQLTEASR